MEWLIANRLAPSRGLTGICALDKGTARRMDERPGERAISKARNVRREAESIYSSEGWFDWRLERDLLPIAVGFAVRGSAAAHQPRPAESEAGCAGCGLASWCSCPW